MYAVIRTGGKQYRVSAGDKLKVEKLAAEIGAEVVLDEVLAIGEGESVRVGGPLLAGAAVKATVVAHGKHDKVSIFKYKNKSGYARRAGHRQLLTMLEIADVSLGAAKPAARKPAAKPAKAAEGAEPEASESSEMQAEEPEGSQE